MVLISLYVDDLLIARNSKSFVIENKSTLRTRFVMGDIGEAKLRLDIEISRNHLSRTLNISQNSCKEKIYFWFGTPSRCAARASIVQQIEKFTLETGLLDSTTYPQANGSLMYLMVFTRPGNSFAVGRLLQFIEKPPVG